MRILEETAGKNEGGVDAGGIIARSHGHRDPGSQPPVRRSRQTETASLRAAVHHLGQQLHRHAGAAAGAAADLAAADGERGLVASDLFPHMRLLLG